jgi:hypothetical protein
VLRLLFRISLFKVNKSCNYMCPSCTKVEHPIINTECVCKTRGKKFNARDKGRKVGYYTILHTCGKC